MNHKGSPGSDHGTAIFFIDDPRTEQDIAVMKP